MGAKFWKNKKVVITGGTGFLGGSFVKALCRLGSRVVSKPHKRVDLLSYEDTKKLFKSANIVINCAALDGNAEFKSKHAAQILDTNLRITSNILNSARENDIKEVVLISSAEIYSTDAPNPIKENDDFHQYNGHVANGYILSKRYGETLAELYQSQYGIKTYLPRPSNIYGPGDNFSDSTNKVIPSFIRNAVNGSPIEIWGDGSQIRQFIFVDDVVRSVLTMVEKGYADKMNVSTNEFVSIQDLAKKVYKHLNISPKINLDITKSVGVKNRILDVSRMHNLINFQPLSLDEGIQKTITWYKKNKK